MTDNSTGHKAPSSRLRAPAYDSLPERRSPRTCEIVVRLENVTPIFGGSSRPRAIDEVDVIRAATVRGHLRFWWRALYAAQYSRAEELYEREGALWGRAATDEGKGGRSAVEIRIDVEVSGGIDRDIDLQRTPGAYALWPARAEKSPRRKPGTQFRLTLMAAAENREGEVRNALRAWIFFGGFGGRTRRGLGSLGLTSLEDAKVWLPSSMTRDAIKKLFKVDVFASPSNAPGDVPWLAGAAIHVGKAERDAMKAWTTALDWLKEFRQGTGGQPGDRAREPGTGKAQPQRPSISNWPEADKIRRVKRKTSVHKPRHNETPAWPRAGFGLPIVGQFHKNGRNGKPYDEPDGFELRWRADDTEHDRLASPLIVKALPLANGTFVPCALWLNRAYPARAEVFLRGENNSGAPFDRLVANGDTPPFSALANKASLRQAFLDWLRDKHQTTVLAP